jgi:hypothetical protein
MVVPNGVDVSLCGALTGRVMQGDAAAQGALVEHLWPWWLKLVRASRSMAALARSEDHVREVAARLAEKFSKKGGHALRLYPLWLEKHAECDFSDWMRIVVANTIRDYVREQMGSTKLQEGEISPKRLLNELTLSSSSALETSGFRPPFTLEQVARQVVEFAQGHLPHQQLRAVELWLEGASDAELDQALGTAPGGGRELMRAGVAVLRRKFAGE